MYCIYFVFNDPPGGQLTSLAATRACSPDAGMNRRRIYRFCRDTERRKSCDRVRSPSASGWWSGSIPCWHPRRPTCCSARSPRGAWSCRTQSSFLRAWRKLPPPCSNETKLSFSGCPALQSALFTNNEQHVACHVNHLISSMNIIKVLIFFCSMCIFVNLESSKGSVPCYNAVPKRAEHSSEARLNTRSGTV